MSDDLHKFKVYTVYPLDGSPVRSYIGYEAYAREERRLAMGDLRRLAQIESMKPAAEDLGRG